MENYLTSRRRCRNDALLANAEIGSFGCLKANGIQVIESTVSIHSSVITTMAVVEVNNHFVLHNQAAQRFCYAAVYEPRSRCPLETRLGSRGE